MSDALSPPRLSLRLTRWLFALSLLGAALIVGPRVDGQIFLNLAPSPSHMVIIFLPCHPDIDVDWHGTGSTPREDISEAIIEAVGLIPTHVRYTILSCRDNNWWHWKPEDMWIGNYNVIIGFNDLPPDPVTDAQYQAYLTLMANHLRDPTVWRTYPQGYDGGTQNWSEMIDYFTAVMLGSERHLNNTGHAEAEGPRETILAVYDAMDNCVSPYTITGPIANDASANPVGFDLIILGPTPSTTEDNTGLQAWTSIAPAYQYNGLDDFAFTSCYELDPCQQYQQCGSLRDGFPYDECGRCRRAPVKFQDVIIWEDRNPNSPTLNPDQAPWPPNTVPPLPAIFNSGVGLPNGFEINIPWAQEYNTNNFPAYPPDGYCDTPLDCSTEVCCSGGFGPGFGGATGNPCPPAFEDCTDGIDNDGDMKPDCYDQDCSGIGLCRGMEIIDLCDSVTVDGPVDGAPSTHYTPQGPWLDAPEDAFNADADASTHRVDIDFNDDTLKADTLDRLLTIAGDVLGIVDASAAKEKSWARCHNGIDDDGDGMIDCADNSCKKACRPEKCTNGKDDNRNGLVDCADPQCFSDPACGVPTPTPTPTPMGPEICNDGIDNDGNGLIDCADPACVFDPACTVSPEICNDGIDNDGNGLIDCADPACATDPFCFVPGVEVACADGLDNDGDGLVDCADPDCFGSPSCSPGAEICNDGIDNDGNGLIDCSDPACGSFPSCSAPVSGTARERCYDVNHVDNLAYWLVTLGFGKWPTPPNEVEGFSKKDWYRYHGIFYARKYPHSPYLANQPPSTSASLLDREEHAWYRTLRQVAEVGQGQFHEVWSRTTTRDALVGIATRPLPLQDILDGQTNPVILKEQGKLYKAWWEAHPTNGSDEAVSTGHLECWNVDENPVSPTYGQVTGLCTAWGPTGDAADRLNSRSEPGNNPGGIPGATSARNVYTNFAEDGLNAAPRSLGMSDATTLAPLLVPVGTSKMQYDYNADGVISQSDAAELISFVRGVNTTTTLGVLRGASRLGDSMAVHPVYAPAKPGMITDRAGLVAFLNKLKLGQDLLLLNGNDGAVHAFRTGDGVEQWAYVPGTFLKWDTFLPYNHPQASTIHGLMQQGRMANNDGRLTMDYVWLDGVGNNLPGCGLNTAPDGKDDPQGCEWHRVLVSTTGRGGRFAYAIDVSDWQAPRFLWEVHDAKISDLGSGYKIGQAALVQLFDSALGKRRWVAVYANGTNPVLSGPVSDLHPSLHIVPLAAPMDYDITGVDANAGGTGILTESGDGDTHIEYTPLKNGSLFGTPAVLDVTGDGVADVAYVGDRAGYMYKFCFDPGSPDTPTSIVFSSPPVGGNFLAPDQYAIFYSPAAAYDASGKLHLFYGTGDPANAVSADQGLFYSVIDPDPTGCTLPATPGCQRGGAMPSTYYALSPLEKMLGAPVVLGGQVIFSTLSADPSSIPVAGPAPAASFCPTALPVPNITGMIHAVDFKCNGAMFDYPNDTFTVLDMGAGGEAIQLDSMPSAPDVSSGHVYIGQHGVAQPLSLNIAPGSNGGVYRSYYESFVVSYRQGL